MYDNVSRSAEDLADRYLNCCASHVAGSGPL